jgi:hypothetical protein
VSISNDGNVGALGIPQADLADGALADNGGIVRMYHYIGSNWVLNSTLQNQDTDADDMFGMMVQLSGDGKRMIVSAGRDNDDRGKLYTFEYTGTSWRKKEPNSSFTATGVNTDDFLGYGATTWDQGVTLSRDGSVIVGGELGHDTATLSNAGRVRVWNMPSTIKSIWGSNDDVNWTKITIAPTREEATSNVAGLAFGYDDRLEFKNLDNPNYYKYHAIVADAFTRLKDVKLYGIRNQGSSTLHDGTLTLTKKVTAPQLESTGIINMKGDYTEIRANSNVVTEFQRSKKFIKYPRVALTSAAQTSSGYEGYFTSQASATLNETSNRQAWAFFDTQGPGQGTALTSPHLSISTDRFDTNGNYTGGDSLAGVSGDWIYIRLPDKIQLQSVDLWARYGNVRNPIDATVLGSLNGMNWSVIGSWQNAKFESGGSTSFTINSIQYYNYIGFVFEKIEANSSGKFVNFHEIDLYGIPEYDPEAHGTDVVVKSVPNVPNTDWLEVYYDGQDYSTMPATVTDKSGNNHTGTPSGGVGFDSTYKAFTFDGSNDYISSPTTATLSNHTASMWIKFDSPAAWEAVYSIKPASGFDRNNFILYVGNNFFRLESSGNTGPYYDINYTFVPGTWVHLTLVFRGTGLEDCELYIDNVRLVPSGDGRSETDDITITGTNTIYVGSDPAGYYLDGSIANFRLFNRALTTDEIYQLYAYQKEYFGHGALGMTLKAGRLGIGTSEPRVALDVRGNIIGGCPAAFSVAYNPTSLSGNQTIIWNLVYHNVGGGYNSSNGLFTAPVSGYYHFTVWGMTSSNTSGVVEFQFEKNGSTVQQRPYGNAGSNYGNATGSIIEYLNIGDTMSIFLTDSTTMYAASGQSYNGFSGFYLSS